jgi:hypothetical protein
MSRKQRSNSPRKPMAAGTLTDLEPWDQEDPDEPQTDPAKARDKSHCYVEPGRGDVNVFTAMYDIGGESG